MLGRLSSTLEDMPLTTEEAQAAAAVAPRLSRKPQPLVGQCAAASAPRQARAVARGCILTDPDHAGSFVVPGQPQGTPARPTGRGRFSRTSTTPWPEKHSRRGALHFETCWPSLRHPARRHPPGSAAIFVGRKTLVCSVISCATRSGAGCILRKGLKHLNIRSCQSHAVQGFADQFQLISERSYYWATRSA